MCGHTIRGIFILFCLLQTTSTTTTITSFPDLWQHLKDDPASIITACSGQTTLSLHGHPDGRHPLKSINGGYNSVLGLKVLDVKEVVDGVVRLELEQKATMVAAVVGGQLHGPVVVHQGSHPVQIFGRLINGQFRGHSWTFKAEKSTYVWSCSSPSLLGKNPLEVLERAEVGPGDRFVAGRKFPTWGQLTDSFPPNIKPMVAFGGECPLDLKEPMAESGFIFSEKDELHVDTRETIRTCRGFDSESTDFKSQLGAWREQMYSLDKDVLWDFGDYGALEEDGPLFFQLHHHISESNFSASLFFSSPENNLEESSASISSQDPNKKLDPKRPIGFVRIQFEIAQPLEGFEWRVEAIQSFLTPGGLLHGPTLIETSDGRFVNTRLRNGVLHSLFVLMGHMPAEEQFRGRKGETMKETNEGMPGLGHVIPYINGRPSLPTYAGRIGQSLIYRNSSTSAYIFPDLETALIGDFASEHDRGGRMLRAVEGRVTGVKCDPKTGILEPIIQIVEEKKDVEYSYAPATNTSLGPNPHLIDPFQAKMSQVRESAIPNSGQGLFMLQDVPKETYVAVYSILRLRSQEELLLHYSNCHHNPDLSDSTRRACTAYDIPVGHNIDLSLTLPPELQGRDQYSATGGHKCNCAILGGDNSKFTELDHPRFGLIIGLITTKALRTGEEVLVDYGYDRKGAKFPWDHPWYHEMKKEQLKKNKVI